MNRVAFTIGSLSIHWYGILVAAGFVAGLWTASRRAPRYGITAQTVADLGPWVIVGAIVGARGLYVASYWREEFAGQSLWTLFNIRIGLVFYGGLIGASLATILFARRRGVPLWRLGDALAPSIPLGHAFGRVGCFTNGCCYGRSTDLPWAVHYDDFAPGVGVHPAQLYEAALNLLLFAALAWQYRRKRFDGHTVAWYLISYALIRFGVEFFRGDYGTRAVLGLKPGQAVSVLILAAGLALFFTQRAKATPARP